MRITLRLFASLRQRLPPGSPRGQCHLELADGTTVGAVLDQMGIQRPAAQMILVNGLDCKDMDHALEPDDVLSVFPPLAGG